MLSKFLRKSNYYYITYLVGNKNNMEYGHGTFKKRGLPDIKSYLNEIHNMPENKDNDYSVVILSCIEVKEDFIK